MLANKIKPKIVKVINKFPTQVTILRDRVNDFGEPDTPYIVCEIKGFWHDGSNALGKITKITEGGEIKREKQYYLMVVYDQISSMIQEGDYFILNGTKYSILDLGNCNNLNIYLDLLLKRC